MNQVRLVFLGTSAGTPSRERNLPAVALVMDGRALLFDCGEGTQQQILRSTVRAGAIEAIFLSHMHGDHLYGLPGLLATMSLHGRSEPLTLFGPERAAPYLRGVYEASYAQTAFDLTIVAITDGATIRRDGYDVHARLLDHTAPCFGYAIVEHDRPGAFDVVRARALGVPAGPLYRALQNGNDVTLAGGKVVRSADVVGPPRPGRRIVYCTDTRPCRAAVELARGADVLVHEATYGDDMKDEAGERGHSTAAGAAGIAAEAGVRRLLLTHISPRYGDAAPLLAEARAVFAETELAADFAEVDVPHSISGARRRWRRARGRRRGLAPRRGDRPRAGAGDDEARRSASLKHLLAPGPQQRAAARRQVARARHVLRCHPQVHLRPRQDARGILRDRRLVVQREDLAYDGIEKVVGPQHLRVDDVEGEELVADRLVGGRIDVVA
jgi:ribonuclease Z